MPPQQAPMCQVQMLIRRPPADVFAAFVDPATTTRFWFSESSGRLEPGASVRWRWGWYGVEATVAVKAVEPGARILIEWGDPARPVEWTFAPHEGGTVVRVTEAGFTGTGDEVVAAALDSRGGFTIVLAAAKVFLEHGIEPGFVADQHPEAHVGAR